MKYVCRRASKARWLQNAPEYILDVFDNKGKTADRYTVMFTGSLLISDGTFANTHVQYLAMSGAPSHPQGVSMWGELTAYEAARFRYRSKHQRIKWDDLPEHIRKHVIARVKE